MSRIIEPGNRLYDRTDENLRDVRRARYHVNILEGLEKKFFNFMENFYTQNNSRDGAMVFLGYDDSMLVPELGGPYTGFINKIKEDLLKGKVNLQDDYGTIKEAILKVLTDKENNDGCFLVDLEGKIYSGYEIDVDGSRIFSAMNTSLDEIRRVFFNVDNFGATRFKSFFKAIALTVGSIAAYIKKENGLYFAKNDNGKIYIPHSINANPTPIKGEVLDTNFVHPNEEKSQLIPCSEELITIR